MYRIEYQCNVEHGTLRKSRCFLCGSIAAGEKTEGFIYFDCPDCGAYFVINRFKKLAQERPAQFKKLKKEIQSKISAKHEFMGGVPVILPFETKDPRKTSPIPFWT